MRTLTRHLVCHPDDVELVKELTAASGAVVTADPDIPPGKVLCTSVSELDR